MTKDMRTIIKFILGYAISTILILVGIPLVISQGPNPEGYQFILSLLYSIPINGGWLILLVVNTLFLNQDFTIRSTISVLITSVLIQSGVLITEIILPDEYLILTISGFIGLAVLVSMFVGFQLSVVRNKFNNSKKIKKTMKNYEVIKYLGKGKQKFQIAYYHSTRILFYYYIVLIGLSSILILVIFGLYSAFKAIMELFLIGIIVTISMNIIYFTSAILQFWTRKITSKEYLFNKRTNMLTKSRINSLGKKIQKKEIALTDIKQIVLEKVVYVNTEYATSSTTYKLKLKLINGNTMTLYKSYNEYKIENYAKQLSQFLGLKLKYLDF